MTMLRPQLYSIFFAAATVAQNATQPVGWDTSKNDTRPSRWDDSTWIGTAADFPRASTSDIKLLESSLASPSASRSVSFAPFANFTRITEPNSNWTFRINVSSIPVPASPDGSQVVAASFDLSWPGGGNMSAGGAKTICITIPWVENWPVNVTNAYSESSSGSTSCEPVLGKACVDAIVGLRRDSMRSSQPDRGCPSPGSISDLPECAGSFGYGRKTARFSGSITQGLNVSGSRVNYSSGLPLSSSRYWPWTSGRGLYTQLSAPVKGADSSTYLEYTNRLHIALLGASIESSSSGQLDVAELLCMRVNYTKLADNVRQDGNITSVKDSVLVPARSGAVMANSGSMVWLATGLSLGVMLLVSGL